MARGSRLSRVRQQVHRRTKIEEIYSRWVPVPDARGDRIDIAFLDEVKKIVLTAITEIKEKVEQIGSKQK